MAGGPMYPSSLTFGSSGEIYPGTHVGATNSRTTEGISVIASLASDRTAELRFDLPPTLPTGTLKLQILSLSGATIGIIVLEPLWFSATPGVDVTDTVTVVGETDTTITWVGTTIDELIVTKITLDASTAPVGGDTLVLHLKFDATSTLAAVSTHRVSIIWE